VIPSVDPGDATKAKTEIKININQRDMIKKDINSDGDEYDHENHADYDFIYNSIKNRLHQEVEKVMKVKKSMEIKSFVDLIIKRLRNDETDPKPKWDDSWIKKDKDGRVLEHKPMISSTRVQEIISSSCKYVSDTQKDELKNLFIQE
jgi:hypothetical protein